MIHLEDYLPIDRVDEYLMLPDYVHAEAASHYESLSLRRPDMQDWELACIAVDYTIKEYWEYSDDGKTVMRREES